jgi:hypothetical protein
MSFQARWFGESVARARLLGGTQTGPNPGTRRSRILALWTRDTISVRAWPVPLSRRHLADPARMIIRHSWAPHNALLCRKWCAGCRPAGRSENRHS